MIGPDYPVDDEGQESEATPAVRAVAFIILLLVLSLALTGLCALLMPLTAVVVYGNFMLITLLGIAYRLALLYNPE